MLNKHWFGGKRKLLVIGCDPGPKYSAVVSVRFEADKKCIIDKALYLSNEEWADGVSIKEFITAAYAESIAVFVYERIKSTYGASVGFSVTDTAAMTGDLRCSFRPYVEGIYAMGSSDWRHAITGRGNAPDAMTREFLASYFEPFGGGKDPYKGVTKQPGPWWPLVEAGAPKAKGESGNFGHLLDAVGTAIGITRSQFMSNKDPEEFRTF